MKSRLLLLLLPTATLVGFLLTHSFLLRSATTLLCLLLVVLHARRAAVHTAVAFVCGALLFSFLGDYVLGHRGGSFGGFVGGVALFLVAHLGYVGYSLCRGRLSWWWLAALTLAFGVGYHGLLLRPHIGDAVTNGAVLAYVLVSCLSLAAALGIRTSPPDTLAASCSQAQKFLFAAGIACLLFSDLLIAQKRFLHDGTLYALMFPTYFASQLLVTASLLWSHRHS